MERSYSSCLMGDPGPSPRASTHSDQSSAPGDLYRSSSCLCGLTKDVHAHSFPFLSNLLLFNLTHSPSPLFSALILPLFVCPCAMSCCLCSSPVPPAASGRHLSSGTRHVWESLCPNAGKMPPFGSFCSNFSGSLPRILLPKFTVHRAFTLLSGFRILHSLILHFLCWLLLPFRSLLPPSFSPFPLSPHTITRFLWFPGCNSGAGASVPTRVNDVSLIYFLP